jgi:hypothetical protein
LENNQSNATGWSDDDSDSEIDQMDYTIAYSRDGNQIHFGLIPRFSHVYEVKVSLYTMVFGCTCNKHQERMGMACRHIAVVCQGNSFILGEDPKGFPLSLIPIFWWNQYYLYGLSQKKDCRKSKEAIIALAKNDTQGLACPGRLDIPMIFVCLEYLYEAFYMPATDRLVLNYNSYNAIGAVQQMRDRNNPKQLVESVMPGLSQLGCLPVQDELDSKD